MTIGRNGTAPSHINRLFGLGTLGGLSEPQLLERYVDQGDEMAFEALVARYGPMVLGVCRRALSDPNDAEDAFQATFLILVRKAGTLSDRTLLGNWLYGVARRVALRARANASRRRFVEGRKAFPLGKAAPEDAYRSEVGHVIDEEISRLPEHDRMVLVLCDLQGESGEDAAQRLGLQAVTLRSRLHRARKRLKDRLARRDIVPGMSLAAATRSVALPEGLLETTVNAAIQFAESPVAIGAVSAPVAALTEGVLRTMLLTKLKIAAVVVLGLATSGAVGLAQAPKESAPASADDRLEKVEQKLDEVLRALEGNVAKRGKTSSNTATTTSKAYTVPKTAKVYNYVTTTQTSPAIVSVDATKAGEATLTFGTTTTGAAAPTEVVTEFTGIETIHKPASTAAATRTIEFSTANREETSTERFSQVEKRLSSLERRIADLERALSKNTSEALPGK